MPSKTTSSLLFYSIKKDAEMKDIIKLSIEWDQKTLMNLGFTETEAYIYLYLKKEGPKKAKEIRKALNVPKERLYRNLKGLQRKCIIKTLGYPSLFSAEPLEKVVDLLIKEIIEQAIYVIQNKEELLSIWRSIIREEYFK